MICSIIVLNYFGEKVIDKVLDSLLNLNFPKNQYEIIIVDNNSTDKSRSILEEYAKKHNIIKNIFLDKNYGFSKGNNYGIRASRGDFVVLLNNDCVVDPNWLKELVATAKSHPDIFAVNSKILLYPKYINLVFDIDPYLIPQYSWISRSNIYNFNKKRIYLTVTRKESSYQTEVLYDPMNDTEIEMFFVFNCGNEINSKDLKSLIKFHNKNVRVIECTTAKNEVSCEVRIDLKKSNLSGASFNKIQNAGIMPFQDGYARDIGGLVKESRHFFEHDIGQYNKSVEVYAACGAAILLRKQYLHRIGLLDESFFMYYEDVEISERARLRGLKIMYSPKAVVRHLHALSSEEGSSFFKYHVEIGRLLHMFYNFPLSVFISEYFRVVLSFIYGSAKALIYLRHIKTLSKKTRGVKAPYRHKVQMVYIILFFITRLPWLLYLKYKKNKDLKRGAIFKNYDEILSGRWYF